MMRWLKFLFLTLASIASAFAPSSNINRRIQMRIYIREDSQEQDSDIGNFFTSLFNNNNESPAPIVTKETEEEKQKRLRAERLVIIEEGEVRRQQRVSDDKYIYLFLFTLQFLPLLGNHRVLSVIYFFGVAVSTVYLGGRQEVIDAPEKVSRNNALYAPIGASISIGGLYLLLKVGIDITSFYAVVVTLFGALAISGKNVCAFKEYLCAPFIILRS